MTNKYKTTSYLIATLKKYNINTIVASPGVQNSWFNASVQEDNFFKCFSVIDERSAAYVATGIINEINKPVVITCTGATASRNYMSALTEAYYRKLPVIAITFYNPFSNSYNMEQQYVDRRISQSDIKTADVHLPIVKDDADISQVLVLLNIAITTALYKNEPVHINCPAYYDYETIYSALPEVPKMEYYEQIPCSLSDELNKQDSAIFIGTHNHFSKEAESAISNFAVAWDIPVICDHVSKYHGANKVLVSQSFLMRRNLTHKPKLIIDIGNLSGDFAYKSLFKSNPRVWRVSNNADFKFRNNVISEKYFNISEKTFFESLLPKNKIKNGYYSFLKKQLDNLSIPDLPLCNSLICQKLAELLPKNCALHASIYNSIQQINRFQLDESIDVNCNIGGFGIDGSVSTIVGQSIINPEKKYYGLIGDSAFFYDMNVLGIRHIKNNLRIIVINNGKGVLFRLGESLEKTLEEKTDILIASGGHNKGGAKGWAESCGFGYMKAENKEEFLSQINSFCNDDFDKPILFEVFTTTKDEQDGNLLMQNHNKNNLEEGAIKIYKAFKG